MEQTQQIDYNLIITESKREKQPRFIILKELIGESFCLITQPKQDEDKEKEERKMVYLFYIEVKGLGLKRLHLSYPQTNKLITFMRDNKVDLKEFIIIKDVLCKKEKGYKEYYFDISIDKQNVEDTITPKETEMSKQGALDKLEELTTKVAEKNPKLLEKLNEIKNEVQEVVELPRKEKKLDPINQNERNIEELMIKARLAIMHDKWDTITQLEKDDIQKIEIYWREIRKATHPNDRKAFSKAKE